MTITAINQNLFYQPIYSDKVGYAETLANYSFIPVAYLSGKDSYEITNESIKTSKAEGGWLKTAVFAALYFPGLILGTIARSLSHRIDPVAKENQSHVAKDIMYEGDDS